MMGCNKCFETIERNISAVFRKYGRFVARHPWKIIATAVLVNGLLGIGMVRLNRVIDVKKVYTPIGSQASKDGDYVASTFSDASGSNYLGYQMPDLGQFATVVVRPNSGNVLEIGFLTSLAQLYTYVTQISVVDGSGNTINYTAICSKNSGKCAVDGDLFIDSEFAAAVTAKSVNFPFFYHKTRGPIYYAQYVGGALVLSGKLQSAPMILLTFNLRTDSEYYKKTSKKWENSFQAAMQVYSHTNFTVTYAHSDSLSQELDENVSGDIAYFSITITLMITYACVATLTARCDVVGQRSNLGFAGVLAAGLSIVSAFGLGCACGVDFVSIVGVLPFLIIGIGVDDMFLLLSGIANADYNQDLETRIGETMATSGVSITITSLTDLLAFAAGASSVFPGVRNFCIYSGIAVLFCYLNQATLFISAIAINEARTKDNRHFATCRKVPVKSDDDKSDVTQSGCQGACSVICCSGRPSKNQEETESFLDRIPRLVIPKLTKPWPMKVVVLLVFAGYLAVSIYGTIQLKEGLVLKNLVSTDSYYYAYSEWLEHFPQDTIVSVIFNSVLTYSDSTTESKINQCILKFKDDSTIQTNFEINWFSAFNSSAGNSTSEDAYIKSLNAFLSMPTNIRFQNDVIIDTTRNIISASRIHLISEGVRDSRSQGNFMLRMRELADDCPVSAIAFSPAFLFYEQYVIVLSQTLQTMGIAVAMVFFVTCIFMPHPLLLLYITATVSMITVGVFGFLSFLDLTLSSVTMIHIVMSIGFSVDFAAHICHAYMISKGNNRDDRMQEGIKRSGAPIFHGAISSLLGVVVLGFAKSYIFFSFFQVMSLVVTFGILHAVILLPVVLSLIGPVILESDASASGSQSVSSTLTGQQNTAHELESRPEQLDKDPDIN